MLGRVPQAAAVLGRDGVEAKQRIRRERPVFADGVGDIIADGGLVLPDVIIELETARKRGEERLLFALVGEAVLQVVFKGQVIFEHHVIGDALGGEAEIARLRRHADFALKLILNVEQALDQQRVEHAAFAVLNHPNGGFVRIGLFVAAFAGQRVVYVREGDDLRRDRNLVADKAIRVAAPVVTLVMPAADLIGDLNQRLILRHRKVLQDGSTDGGMRLDDLEFLRCQLAGFVEDGIRNADFADVVQGGSGADERDIVLRQGVAIRLARKLAQQKLRDGLNVLHMQPTFGVAKLDDVAKDAGHQAVALFAPVNLFGYHAHQVLLLAVEHQRVDDAAANGRFIERAADVIRRAELIGALNEHGVAFRRDHNDRGLVDPVLLAHDGQHAETVQFRHDDIQQDKADIAVGAQNVKGLQPVFRLQKIVAVIQNAGQNRAVHFGIINNQDFLFLRDHGEEVTST